MTPESYGLQIALTFVALLLAALGAVLLSRDAREDTHAPSLDLHNGAFTRLEDALRSHLNPAAGLAAYDPVQAGLDADLQGPLGPKQTLLDRLDPLLQTRVAVSGGVFKQLLAFLTDGLLDPKARPENLRKLIPARPPSGRPFIPSNSNFSRKGEHL